MAAFSAPLMLSNVLQVLFNMVDIAVVGKFAGTAALGAVGSTPNLLFLFTGLLMGLGGGVNVTTAYFIGAKNEKALSETVHTAALLCLFCGVVLMAAGIAFGEKILSAMDTKPALLPDAALYFKIYMASMPAAALYNFGSAVLSAAGDTKKPLLFLSAAGAANVALDLILVAALGMGARGAAIATVASQCVSAVLTVASLARRRDAMALSFRKLKAERTLLLRLAAVGIPSGMQNAIFAFANVFVQVGVNSFDETMVAGNAASANIDPVIYNVMSAFYVACATFIGRNFGAGSKERVKKSYLAGLALSFGSALALGALLFFFGRSALAIFTNDSAVIECAMRRTRIMAFSYCVSAFMDCSIAACRGLGKTLMPSVFVFLGSCVFRVAWVFTVFARFKTIESLFSLYAFSWAITACAEIAWFARVCDQSFPPRDAPCA